MIAVVILSAGASIRMGTPKANLKIGSTTFINFILSNLRFCEFNPVFIVTGYHHQEIAAAVHTELNYKILRNPEPQRGQLSSLQVAIRHFSREITGLLMILVDHPLVQEETYQKLFKTARQYPQSIIIPTYRKRKGHPVYFSNDFFPALMETSWTMGAREVIKENMQAVHYLPVLDKGILLDIDTPEDLRKYIG